MLINYYAGGNGFTATLRGFGTLIQRKLSHLEMDEAPPGVAYFLEMSKGSAQGRSQLARTPYTNGEMLFLSMRGIRLLLSSHAPQPV